MPSYAWRDSGGFWVHKIRRLFEITNSMREHGGFAFVINHWSLAAKQECIAELDRFIEILGEWKKALQEDLSDSTQPIGAAVVIETAGPAKAPVRVTARHPNLVLLRRAERR